MDNHILIERYLEAVRTADIDALAELVHPDVVVRYPQSGEVIKGRDNYIAMLRAYPEGLQSMQKLDAITGEQEVQVTRPLPFGPPTITLVGETDTVFTEGIVDYGEGVGIFHIASITRIREGRVAEETSYFCEPFEAPEWRARFCES